VSTPALDDPLGVLRRVIRPRERPVPGERCDMCGEPIAEAHSHVANIGDRRLMCTCRGCYLLFTVPGAGGLRMRAVPERYRLVDGLRITQRQWDDLAIPVDLVFVFRQSEAGSDETRLVAWYPSPAGATESELDQEPWESILAAAPGTADLIDDVEALLLRRTARDAFLGMLVPIDVCYELVGLVRTHWVGFQGGTEVWQRIDAFFDGLRSRAARSSR
jgi:hypothetical protein